MALLDSNAPSSGIFGAIKGALNLFSGLNKTESGNNTTQNIPIDNFESSFSEARIISLTSQWKARYSKYYQDIAPSTTIAFQYWLGQQRTEDMDAVKGGLTLIDNQIFQAIETFIPIATGANPDPIVTADSSPQGQILATGIKNTLVNEAQRQKLKKILKKVLRQWMIYKIGVLKTAYNIQLNQIETYWVNPKRMIFDVDGHIDEAGKFTGEYLGERKQDSADNLIQMFPKKEKDIYLKVAGKLGTQLEYIEWTYKGRDIFYTMDEMVLGKFKNPHWNYDDEKEGIEGKNFLDEPCDMYVFLSIFSTGLQPHDETSLITQNISLQDLINKRIRQIDKNVDSMNNGLVVSSDFTSEQASLAAAALRKGTAIRSASKNVTDSVMRLPAVGLPSDVFGQLKDTRQELQDIFGTSGSTPQGQANIETARGKILVKQLDTSRIGGTITEALEGVAETVYRQWIQLMFVHYTDPHYIISADSANASAMMQIKNTDFLLTKTLQISVRDGSLIPKDALTERNEAVDLWDSEAIDPLSFYKKLDFPDPVQSTNQLILWEMFKGGKIQPQQYLSSFQYAQPVQQQQQQVQEQPIQVNPGPEPQTPPPSPQEGTQDAVAKEERDLIESVPLKS